MNLYELVIKCPVCGAANSPSRVLYDHNGEVHFFATCRNDHKNRNMVLVVPSTYFAENASKIDDFPTGYFTEQDNHLLHDLRIKEVHRET
jgi:NAD-dependent SIR2 family protein deacetylase